MEGRVTVPACMSRYKMFRHGGEEEMKTIRSFDDFVQDLREAGFIMGGDRDGGIFTLAACFRNTGNFPHIC